ncbi:MAG: NitT/TauT family transport system ATP-binding protein [Acidobacteriota bacterium]|nr:NitT/TauT family transport system ATP-binding protein [Acidobacteriota bacterium]
MASVEFSEVVKVYLTAQGTGFLALDSVSFGVPDAGFTSLLGPSGCGKSTCLRLAAGLSSPTSGSIRVGDQPVEGPQTGFGMVFQSDVLLDWRSTLRNVLLPTEASGFDASNAEAEAMELLDSVGLAGFETSRPHELSGGMRQRVAICRALITHPQLLLMDEPFGAVDAITRDQLALDLQRLWETRKTTVLFVTHSIAEAVFLSDDVIVMASRPGRIEAIVHIDLPRPRTLSTRELPEFSQYVRDIRQVLERSGTLRDYQAAVGA